MADAKFVGEGMVIQDIERKYEYYPAFGKMAIKINNLSEFNQKFNSQNCSAYTSVIV